MLVEVRTYSIKSNLLTYNFNVIKILNFNLDTKKSIYLKHLLLCTGAIIVSWLVSILSCTLIALILTKLGKVMSWYARPAWLFFLYVVPTIFISMTFFLFIGSRQKKASL